jgi:hypothetical protein
MSSVVRKLGKDSQTYTTVEKKLTSKEDLKMGDLLTYYAADAQAARELMVRRIKAIKARGPHTCHHIAFVRTRGNCRPLAYAGAWLLPVVAAAAAAAVLWLCVCCGCASAGVV